MPHPNQRNRTPMRRRPRTGFRPQLEVLEDRTLLSAGALDPTFGVEGKVVTDFGALEGTNRRQYKPMAR